jgi:hypothetical protein
MGKVNYRFKAALLGLLHDNMRGRTERFYQQAARCGVQEIRAWPQRSDWITDGSLATDTELRKRYREHLRRCKEYGITPDTTVCYERKNRKWTHAERIPHLRAIGADNNAIIGEGKGKLSLNEVYTAIAPIGFGVTCEGQYYPHKPDRPGSPLTGWYYHRFQGPWHKTMFVDENKPENQNMLKVRLLAAYIDWLYTFMHEEYGLPIENLIVDVLVDPAFPARMDSHDATMAGGLGGEWFGRDDTARVVGAFHGIVLAEDIWHSQRCGGHLREARRILNLELSNDGGSTGKPTGKSTYVNGDPVYTDANDAEFKAKNALIWKLAQKGVPVQTGVLPEDFFKSQRRLPLRITNEWLPREVFVKCTGGENDTRKWVLDLEAIDWKRVMRCHPPEYIKEHNLPGPLPEETGDPEPVDPEPVEDPVDPDPEETQSPRLSPWRHLVPKWRWRKPFLLINFKAFLKEATFWQRVVFWAPALGILAGIAWGVIWIVRLLIQN